MQLTDNEERKIIPEVRKQSRYRNWLKTYTKKAVTIILIVSILDLQMSYILAFMGRDQIAETLSSTIAEVIIGVMLGYFMKACCETFLENREIRLRRDHHEEGK